MQEEKIYLVLGLGNTGLSIIKHLVKDDHSVVRVIDSRLNPPERETCQQAFPQVEIFLLQDLTVALNGVVQVFVSPGLAPSSPLCQQVVQQGYQLSSDIDLFCALCPGRVVAVTGTNGKSTTTAWLAHVIGMSGFSVLAGGNLGTPVLDLLELPNANFYVLELSSYQLAYCQKARFECGVILNIASDHLEWHKTWDHYVHAKFRLAQLCQHIILNGNDAVLRELDLTSVLGQFTYFAADPKSCGDLQPLVATSTAAQTLMLEKDLLCSVSELPLIGGHNLSNALAVIALARAIGMTRDVIVQGLKSFVGLAHRCQKVDSLHPALWYNDSKATNVSAMLAAVQSFIAAKTYTGRMILLAGGQAKQGSWAGVASHVLEAVDVMIVYGEAGHIMAQVFADETCVVPVLDLAEAVAKAAQISGSEDLVLLSPACASFDQYVDYQARGQHFIALVGSLSA